MNYLEVYDNIFSNVKNYCYKEIINEEPKHDWLLELISKNNFNSVVDIGAGTGAMLTPFLNKDIDILAADLKNFLSYPSIPFKEINLINELNLEKVYDLLICCDVIEHLPIPESVNILDKIKPFGKKFLIGIANHSDIIRGIELHLTRENKDFWDLEISKRFTIIKSNSYYNDRLFLYELQ